MKELMKKLLAEMPEAGDLLQLREGLEKAESPQEALAIIQNVTKAIEVEANEAKAKIEKETR